MLSDSWFLVHQLVVQTQRHNRNDQLKVNQEVNRQHLDGITTINLKRHIAVQMKWRFMHQEITADRHTSPESQANKGTVLVIREACRQSPDAIAM